MSHTSLIPRPGGRFGPYPERPREHEPWSFYWAQLLRNRLQATATPSRKEQNRFLQAVHAQRAKMQGCGIEFIAAGARRLRSKLVVQGLEQDLVVEIFALIDACLQRQQNLSLYDPQFLAGWLLLDRRLIEMETGEGKTLAIALAAMTGALAGIPVHVITANDYLVERDAAYLQPLFQVFGLTIGAITGATPTAQRTSIYRSDVTYCTATELAFDYLRDRLSAARKGDASTAQKPGRHLRGLCMAIIDEADNVLIDEARVPLILSNAQPPTLELAFYRQAFFLAAQLKSDEHYHLDPRQRSALLTAAGQARVQSLAKHLGGGWDIKRHREEIICLALAAQHLFVKDRHYLVRDHEIILIDDTSGRQIPGRSWSHGLHQLIEVKEACPLTLPTQTVAQTTFQRFFSRYLRLSGISGTAIEARNLFMAIYALPVARVPLRFSSRRTRLPSRMFVERQEQQRHVVQRVLDLHSTGRPVLIGTDSVHDSEALSTRLHQAGIAHTVLNARFNTEEARIVAGAGQLRAVTVSTNMAGRGTDITLGTGVAALGGLHVIACQTNDFYRIDRQLYGRCARQGEPGTVEHWYCLDHILPASSRMAQWITRRFGKTQANGELPHWLTLLARLKQKRREHYCHREQWFLFLSDRLTDRQFIFTGDLF